MYMEENKWKLPLYKIYSDDEDVNLVTKIIKSIKITKRTEDKSKKKLVKKQIKKKKKFA